MKLLSAFILPLVLLLPLQASADFDTGLRAANRGDFATARREWEPLAAEGDIQATFNLGRMYARGDGTPRNFAKARELFLQAAEKGHARAAFNLGQMYQEGDGVAKDLPMAKSWFQKALAAGEKDASMHLKALKNVPDLPVAPAEDVQVANSQIDTPVTEVSAEPDVGITFEDAPQEGQLALDVAAEPVPEEGTAPSPDEFSKGGEPSFLELFVSNLGKPSRNEAEPNP